MIRWPTPWRPRQKLSEAPRRTGGTQRLPHVAIRVGCGGGHPERKKPSSAVTDPWIRASSCAGSGAGRPPEVKNRDNALVLLLLGPSACAGIGAHCGEIP